MTSGTGRFALPPDLPEDDARAVVSALERYFLQESPHPHAWVLAGRIAATGIGGLQVRRFTDRPWTATAGTTFVRPGVPPMHGRGDAR